MLLWLFNLFIFNKENWQIELLKNQRRSDFTTGRKQDCRRREEESKIRLFLID